MQSDRQEPSVWVAKVKKVFSLGEPTYGNIAWFVKNPKEIHGFEFMHHEEDEAFMIAPDPSIVIHLASPSKWEFKFANSTGEGWIRVGEKCNYNPFCMVEALFHQLEEGPTMLMDDLKDWMTRPDQVTPEKKEFGDEFKEEWE